MDEEAYIGPRRKGLRLPGFDYATPGSYFVTCVVEDRARLLGGFVGKTLILSPAGLMVEAEWLRLTDQHPGLRLDAHVVMPDHFHGLVTVLAIPIGQRPNVSDVINGFKSKTTVEYGMRVRSEGWPTYRKRLWQRGFRDDIIRDARHFENVRRYIERNPARWVQDRIEGPNGMP